MFQGNLYIVTLSIEAALALESVETKQYVS